MPPVFFIGYKQHKRRKGGTALKTIRFRHYLETLIKPHLGLKQLRSPQCVRNDRGLTSHPFSHFIPHLMLSFQRVFSGRELVSIRQQLSSGVEGFPWQEIVGSVQVE